MQFQKILVPVTPGAEPDPAVQVAVSLAKRANGSVTLFDVVQDTSWALQFLTGGWEQAIEDISGTKRRSLQQQVDALVADGVTADSLLSQGKLSVAIMQEVLAGPHDLVVKVAEGAGTNRSGILGSTDLRLLRKCPSTILILSQATSHSFQHVAVALDVMDTHAIQRELDVKVVAAAGAICEGALELVYAIPPLGDCIRVDQDDTDLVTPEVLDAWQADLSAAATERLEQFQQQLRPRTANLHTLHGPPEEAIPQFVREQGIDLLVMGTVARSGLDGFLIGNTAERILDQTECSILALKPESFVSPIGKSSYHAQEEGSP